MFANCLLEISRGTVWLLYDLGTICSYPGLFHTITSVTNNHVKYCGAKLLSFQTRVLNEVFTNFSINMGKSQHSTANAKKFILKLEYFFDISTSALISKTRMAII